MACLCALCEIRPTVGLLLGGLLFYLIKKNAAKREAERKKALEEDMLNIAPGLVGQFDPDARQSYANPGARMSFADGGFKSMARKSISFVNTAILGAEPSEMDLRPTAAAAAARRGTGAVGSAGAGDGGGAARRGTAAFGTDVVKAGNKRRGTAMVAGDDEMAAKAGGGGPKSALKRGSLAVANLFNRAPSSVAEEPAPPPGPAAPRAPPVKNLLSVDEDLGEEADGTPIVQKGLCGSCGLPVFSNQLRKGDGKGNYFHAADCGVESVPPFIVKGSCGTCSKPVYSNQLRKANKGQYYHGKCDPRGAGGEAGERRASMRKPSMAPGAGPAELKPTRPAGLPAVRTGFADPDASAYGLNDALLTNRVTDAGGQRKRLSIYRG